MRPYDAAILSARELVGPIIAMTITLAAVYTPIGLQGGLTGSLFREFAFTLAGAVMISGVVALTLSPMMSAKLLRAGGQEKGMARISNRVFDRIRDFYGRKLDWTLQHRPAVYAVWVALGGFAILMFILLPSFSSVELAPTEDQGVVFGIVDASANSTIEQTQASAEEAGKIFHSFPETNFSFQITFPSSGFGGMVLKPWGERTTPTAHLVGPLTMKLMAIPGIRMFPVMPPALPGGGQFPVEFVLESTAEPERILEFAQTLQGKATQSGMFAFPPLIDTKIDQPQAEIVLDRDKVAALGLNMQQVGEDLGAMLGGNFVNRFNIAGRSYKVIPQIERSARLNPSQLEHVYVTGPENQLVPLSTIATIKNSTVPRSLNKMQQLNAVTIQGVAIRPLDQALKFLETEAHKILPKGYNIDYTGESRQLRTEGNKFLPSLMLALILIFLVLAAQFNSFRDPFIILLGSVPLALFGALIFIFLKLPNPNLSFFTNGWTTSFNIYSQVGLVTLVGLIAKNGILIVEFANKMQETGLDKVPAVAAAARTRLRPVLMTTIATVCGHFPLTLVTGAGAAARNSIGLVLVGGMSIGTIFTLFIVPSLYVLIARTHNEGAKEKSPGTPESELSREPELVPEFADA
jgi:multidrug efflux pump